MKKLRTVYIYAILDNDVPFYVGQTLNVKVRKAAHIRESFLLKSEKDKRIQSILSEGRDIELKVLKECEQKNGLDVERDMIKMYTAKRIKLLNGTHNNYEKFTEIERSLLILMAEDFDTMDLAKALFKSPRTIETIRQRVKEKARVKTVNGLVAWGIKNGYIPI